MSHHHLVLDGWSMPIVTRELVSAYEALRAGRPVDLPRAAPFGEYAAWLARRPAGASEAFWRENLRGLRAPTPLVVDTVARATAGGRPLTGRSRIALEGAPAARLRDFGRRQKLAFATLAQAAWALHLSRCSGERDVLFGVVTSGRSAELEGVEDMVGMFVNSLPVRVRVPRRAPLLPWLQELQASLAALREHEHCSLTQVQGWSQLPAGAPLFESLLAVQTLGPISPELAVHGLSIRPVAGEERVGLPLTVVAYPAPGDGVWLGVEYDRRRIPPEAATPLLERYGRLLTGLAEAADVDAVEMLPTPPPRPAPARPEPELAAALGIAPGDRVLLAAGSGDELRRLPPAARATVVLAGDDEASALAAVTVAIGPPAAWEAWVRAAADLSHLLAVVSGEAASPGLAGELARRCRGLRSLSLETWCVGDPLRHAGLGGSPPARLAADLLDAEQRPLPAGATGEVWLGGERTGWRARLRYDGDLELLGPREPGAGGARPAVSAAEVEALLAGHPAVRRAAVAGDAYVVLTQGSPATAADLRGYLRQHLPAHLVPSRVHVVERLPLDAGRRIDREPLRTRAAPAPDAAGTPDDLLHRLAQAPPERRARFLARLRAELEQPDAGPALRRRAPGEPVPPSFQQEQFWVLERLARGESAHNVSLAIDLPGATPAAAQAALDALVARHEVLRCALVDAPAGLAVEVAAAARAPLAVSDLRSHPEPEVEAARLATAEARLPFDLAAPPLLRARLLLGVGGGARLVLVVPHVATDPASARILTRDLLMLVAGAELPPLPLQYPDYGRWQRERLQRRRDGLLAHWRQQLHGWQALELVTDHPRSPRMGPEGTRARLELPAAVVAGLERMADLRAVLLASFVELLHRWSGQEDVLLGMGVDLRDRPELAGVVG
ncbi:MAG TPA: condensation domain-containing protein, partial [Candidatus Eisenbacteria bacterium]|nr:condensation domain-containing protein [Candidatus Eisenbacteria bacterium]